MTKLPTPFPAFVFDDVHTWDHIDTFAHLDAVIAEFPEPDDGRWNVFGTDHEPEKRQGDPECWGPATTQLVVDLISPEMCQAVASLLGYEVLVGDVHGGGMHLSGPGARLDTHTDFNAHPQTGWRRRANLLLYLNHHWHPDWGGVLDLRGEREGPVEASLTPELGRMVVFECSETSWHGHPRPIKGERWRRSIAVYFYDPTDQVPPEQRHDTLWAGGAGT